APKDGALRQRRGSQFYQTVTYSTATESRSGGGAVATGYSACDGTKTPVGAAAAGVDLVTTSCDLFVVVPRRCGGSGYCPRGERTRYPLFCRNRRSADPQFLSHRIQRCGAKLGHCP